MKNFCDCNVPKLPTPVILRSPCKHCGLPRRCNSLISLPGSEEQEVAGAVCLQQRFISRADNTAAKVNVSAKSRRLLRRCRKCQKTRKNVELNKSNQAHAVSKRQHLLAGRATCSKCSQKPSHPSQWEPLANKFYEAAKSDYANLPSLLAMAADALPSPHNIFMLHMPDKKVSDQTLVNVKLDLVNEETRQLMPKTPKHYGCTGAIPKKHSYMNFSVHKSKPLPPLNKILNHILEQQCTSKTNGQKKDISNYNFRAVGGYASHVYYDSDTVEEEDEPISSRTLYTPRDHLSTEIFTMEKFPVPPPLMITSLDTIRIHNVHTELGNGALQFIGTDDSMSITNSTLSPTPDSLDELTICPVQISNNLVKNNKQVVGIPHLRILGGADDKNYGNKYKSKISNEKETENENENENENLVDLEQFRIENGLTINTRQQALSNFHLDSRQQTTNAHKATVGSHIRQSDARKSRHSPYTVTRNTNNCTSQIPRLNYAEDSFISSDKLTKSKTLINQELDQQTNGKSFFKMLPKACTSCGCLKRPETITQAKPDHAGNTEFMESKSTQQVKRSKSSITHCCSKQNEIVPSYKNQLAALKSCLHGKPIASQEKDAKLINDILPYSKQTKLVKIADMSPRLQNLLGVAINQRVPPLAEYKLTNAPKPQARMAQYLENDSQVPKVSKIRQNNPLAHNFTIISKPQVIDSMKHELSAMNQASKSNINFPKLEQKQKAVTTLGESSFSQWLKGKTPSDGNDMPKFVYINTEVNQTEPQTQITKIQKRIPKTTSKLTKKQHVGSLANPEFKENKMIDTCMFQSLSKSETEKITKSISQQKNVQQQERMNVNLKQNTASSKSRVGRHCLEMRDAYWRSEGVTSLDLPQRDSKINSKKNRDAVNLFSNSFAVVEHTKSRDNSEIRNLNSKDHRSEQTEIEDEVEVEDEYMQTKQIATPNLRYQKHTTETLLKKIENSRIRDILWKRLLPHKRLTNKSRHMKSKDKIKICTENSRNSHQQELELEENIEISSNELSSSEDFPMYTAKSSLKDLPKIEESQKFENSSKVSEYLAKLNKHLDLSAKIFEENNNQTQSLALPIKLKCDFVSQLKPNLNINQETKNHTQNLTSLSHETKPEPVPKPVQNLKKNPINISQAQQLQSPKHDLKANLSLKIKPYQETENQTQMSTALAEKPSFSHKHGKELVCKPTRILRTRQETINEAQADKLQNELVSKPTESFKTFQESSYQALAKLKKDKNQTVDSRKCKNKSVRFRDRLYSKQTILNRTKIPPAIPQTDKNVDTEEALGNITRMKESNLSQKTNLTVLKILPDNALTNQTVDPKEIVIIKSPKKDLRFIATKTLDFKPVLSNLYFKNDDQKETLPAVTSEQKQKRYEEFTEKFLRSDRLPSINRHAFKNNIKRIESSTYRLPKNKVVYRNYKEPKIQRTKKCRSPEIVESSEKSVCAKTQRHIQQKYFEDKYKNKFQIEEENLNSELIFKPIKYVKYKQIQKVSTNNQEQQPDLNGLELKKPIQDSYELAHEVSKKESFKTSPLKPSLSAKKFYTNYCRPIFRSTSQISSKRESSDHDSINTIISARHAVKSKPKETPKPVKNSSSETLMYSMILSAPKQKLVIAADHMTRTGSLPIAERVAINEVHTHDIVNPRFLRNSERNPESNTNLTKKLGKINIPTIEKNSIDQANRKKKQRKIYEQYKEENPNGRNPVENSESEQIALPFNEKSNNVKCCLYEFRTPDVKAMNLNFVREKEGTHAASPESYEKPKKIKQPEKTFASQQIQFADLELDTTSPSRRKCGGKDISRCQVENCGEQLISTGIMSHYINSHCHWLDNGNLLNLSEIFEQKICSIKLDFRSCISNNVQLIGMLAYAGKGPKQRSPVARGLCAYNLYLPDRLQYLCEHLPIMLMAYNAPSNILLRNKSLAEIVENHVTKKSQILLIWAECFSLPFNLNITLTASDSEMKCARSLNCRPRYYDKDYDPIDVFIQKEENYLLLTHKDLKKITNRYSKSIRLDILIKEEDD